MLRAGRGQLRVFAGEPHEFRRARVRGRNRLGLRRVFENDNPQAGDWYYVGVSKALRNVTGGGTPPNSIPIGRSQGVAGLDPIDETTWSFVVVAATTTTSSTSSTSTTLAPPVIVDVAPDVTLWAVYAQVGTIVPQYATNLGVIQIEWTPISVFSNSLVDGTNIVTFDPPDTNAATVMFRLQQTP